MEEEVDNLVKRIEDADAVPVYRHRESWNIVNKVSGRRAEKSGVMKETQEELINRWHDHFKQLLGKLHAADNESQEISQVLSSTKQQRSC